VCFIENFAGEDSFQILFSTVVSLIFVSALGFFPGDYYFACNCEQLFLALAGQILKVREAANEDGDSSVQRKLSSMRIRPDSRFSSEKKKCC